jgi:type II secretory pathway pseudopilin PulG
LCFPVTIDGATSFLLVVGIVFIIAFSFTLFSLVMWVNQKQDERAMAANMKMMQSNAIENMALIEQTQKAMLLQSRTAGQNTANDMKALQLMGQLQQLQAGQVQPAPFLVSDDSLYTNLIEAEND